MRIATFEHAIRDLGWVEGRNLRIEYRTWSTGLRDELRTQVTDLLRSPPEVILANSSPVAVALRDQSETIPVVFVQVMDPVGQGLVASLARPGRNLTGFTPFEFTIGTKWLEMLKVIAPQIARVAFCRSVLAAD